MVFDSKNYVLYICTRSVVICIYIGLALEVVLLCREDIYICTICSCFDHKAMKDNLMVF